jgi:two-component system OmpR family response regulator
LLSTNTPWAVTKQVLLETVGNYGGYDPNVVEVAICGLRRKLESHGPRVIQTVRGTGYAARATPASPG